MTPSKFLLEYLTSAETIFQIKDFLHDLCDLNFHLIDTNGRFLTLHHLNLPAPSLKNHVPIYQTRCGMSGCRWTPRCPLLIKNALENVIATKQPQDFVCPTGYTRVCIPIMLEDEVIACLWVGENGPSQLNRHKIELIGECMKKLTDTVIKNELKALPGLKANGLSEDQRLVNLVMDDVQEHYGDKDLSLRDVSRRNAVSYHRLSRIFKRELKTSFSRYRTKIRMDMASRLLKNRSLTIGQVSDMCGFEDQGYFCKIFKETFGKPPVAYKNYRF